MIAIGGNSDVVAAVLFPGAGDFNPGASVNSIIDPGDLDLTIAKTRISPRIRNLGSGR